MNNRLSLSAFAALGLLASASTLAQSVEPEPDAGTVFTREVRVLPPDVTRSLKIARTPLPTPVPLIVGTYWSYHNRGEHEICRIKLVVCDDDGYCIEV